MIDNIFAVKRLREILALKDFEESSLKDQRLMLLKMNKETLLAIAKMIVLPYLMKNWIGFLLLNF